MGYNPFCTFVAKNGTKILYCSNPDKPQSWIERLVKAPKRCDGNPANENCKYKENPERPPQGIRERKESGIVSKDIVEFKVTEEKLSIEIRIEDLLCAAEGGHPGYVVIDKKAFLDYLQQNIHEVDYDSETGLSGWHRLLDKIFDEAFEEGEEWLHSPFLDEMEGDHEDDHEDDEDD